MVDFADVTALPTVDFVLLIDPSDYVVIETLANPAKASFNIYTGSENFFITAVNKIVL
jgi:hypothetical protein